MNLFKTSRAARMVAVALFAFVMAVLAFGCTPPTAPTCTVTGRNVDGTPHCAGSPLQPWMPAK